MRPAEYGEAGRVVVAAYRALPGGHGNEEYEAKLADVAGRARGAEVLVAVEAAVLGCVTFVPDASSPWAELVGPDESSVRMLAVDPPAQGRGVGGALLRACVERAASLGRRGLFLHSAPWMTAAHALYGQFGFDRVPERDWYPLPDVPLLAFRLLLGEGSTTAQRRVL